MYLSPSTELYHVSPFDGDEGGVSLTADTALEPVNPKGRLLDSIVCTLVGIIILYYGVKKGIFGLIRAIDLVGSCAQRYEPISVGGVVVTIFGAEYTVLYATAP
jgi:hypothetical protein